MPQAATKSEALQAAPPKVEPQRKVEVDPHGVTVNEAGQCWRSVLARMPEGMVSDDLRSPKIWKRVQGVRHAALIKLDHVLVIGFDESWAAECIVTYASSTEASLAILKVCTFREQSQSLYGDGTLEVFWDGSSYGVRRCSDGVRVIAGGFTRADQAETALRSWYPKSA